MSDLLANQYEVFGFTKGGGTYTIRVEARSMEAALEKGKGQIKKVAFNTVRGWLAQIRFEEDGE